MIKGKRLITGAIGATAVVSAIAGVALAAAPQLHAASAYDNFHQHKSKTLDIFLVTAANNPSKLNGGPAIYHHGPEGGSGTLRCAKAPLKPSYRFASVQFGFPGAKLKLTNGSYSFSVEWTARRRPVLGSTERPVTLHLSLTGKVQSPSSITGEFSARGGHCTLKKPLRYTASLDPTFPLPSGS